MLNSEDITQQRELLAIHRRTLHHYIRQQAALGDAHTPPAVTSGMSEARAEIKRIKDLLRAQGAVVDDQPQDDEIDDVLLRTSAHPAQAYRGAMLLVIGGVIGILLLLWRVALPLIQASSTQANGSGVQSTISTTNTAAIASNHPELTVVLPEGDTVTILYNDSKVTYKIMRAGVQPLIPGQSLLSLTIRASTTYHAGINFWARNISLRLKNETLRSTSDFDKAVYPNETQEGVLEFPIPSEPAQARVVFTIGESPVELLLEVK